MSNPTDILGKVGQKVGSEIKNITDNYATKVSLGNVVSTIDFSPYATVVSLGSVKSGLEGDISSAESRLQTSLGKYADGTNIFSSLKATRAEVDELLVKGDTTIVSTQKVEISDNVIEVNLKGDGDVTADTGGVAVNRGLVAEAINLNTDHMSSFGNYTKTADNIDSFEAEFKLSSDLGKPYSWLQAHNNVFINYPGTGKTPKIKFENPSNLQGLALASGTGTFELSDADITQAPSGTNYYRGFLDPGTRVVDKGDTIPLDKRYVPKYLRTKSGPYIHVVWEHNVEDLGNGEQDVWRRLDDTANASGSHYRQLTPSDTTSSFELKIVDKNGIETKTFGTYLTEMEVVPSSEIEYIETFASGTPTTLTSGGAELPPTVVYGGNATSNSGITKWLAHGLTRNFGLYGGVAGTVEYQNSPSSHYKYRSPVLSHGTTTYKLEIEIISGAAVKMHTLDGAGHKIANSSVTIGSINKDTSGTSQIFPAADWTADFVFHATGSSVISINNVGFSGVKPTGVLPAEDTKENLTSGSAGNQLMWAISISGDSSGGVLDAIFVGFGDKSGSGESATLINNPSATKGSKVSDIMNWSMAGVAGDADLLWDEPKGAWVLRKDAAAAKLYYANKFDNESDLPSATDYHGMFAHVHGTGRGYFSHNGAWQELLDLSANQTITGNLDVGAGSAIKVADSSGIKINNVDIGNYSSFESALNTAKT